MHKMRKSQNEIHNQDEMINIINECDVVHIGMSVDNVPYIVPLNFGFVNNTFYFHGDKEGRKMDMIKANPKVCFELDTDHVLIGESDRACDWTMKYASIMGNGTMVIVEDWVEKREALNILMKQYGGESDYSYSDKMLERIGIMKLLVEEMTGKKSN